MEAELQILEEFIKTNPDSRELKRALGVKLALSGYAYRAIQEIIGVTPGFIAKWKKEFISAEIEGIILKYRLYRTCHVKLSITHACKACILRL